MPKNWLGIQGASLKIVLPITIYEDNSAAISSVIGKRTRHIDVKFKFLNHAVEQGNVRLVKVDGAKNIADIFTKALQKDRFIYLANRLVHSTSLKVPQPMTMDQDGPTCMAYAKSRAAPCGAKAEPGSQLCLAHLQREFGLTCAGIAGSGSRCMSHTTADSIYCNLHKRQGNRGVSSRGRITGSTLGLPPEAYQPS